MRQGKKHILNGGRIFRDGQCQAQQYGGFGWGQIVSGNGSGNKELLRHNGAAIDSRRNHDGNIFVCNYIRNRQRP